jgi:serine protease Do
MPGRRLIPPLLIFALDISSGFSQSTHQERTVSQSSPNTLSQQPVSSLGGTRLLEELSRSLEGISERCGPAVVEIFAHRFDPGSADHSGTLLASQSSSASGVLLSPDGYILTNAHAVRGAHSLRVYLARRRSGQALRSAGFHRGRGWTAALVGVDSETDLAVIKVDGSDLPFLEFADSDQLKQGQLVLALGNPLGMDQSVSWGVVSAVSRQMKPDDPMAYIQTDAPINPGNSGGPLLDGEGKVVGINTFILTQSGGSEGMGFAIPSNLASLVYEQLKTQGHVRRAKLGLEMQTINPVMADGLHLEADQGVIVSDVEPEGPAMSAGIKPDDILVALNGKRVRSVRQLEAAVFRQKPGETILLRVQRGLSETDIPLKTGKELDGLQVLADTLDPVNNVVPELGIVGLDITPPVVSLLPNLRRPEGVVVAVRETSAPYSGPALEVGDVIYELNRQIIATVAELRHALGSRKAGDAAVLLVEREGRLRYLALELN